MGVGLGGTGATMEDSNSFDASSEANIKEEAETSADSLTIDVEGHDDVDTDTAECRAWISALRTHVVVPLIR